MKGMRRSATSRLMWRTATPSRSATQSMSTSFLGGHPERKQRSGSLPMRPGAEAWQCESPFPPGAAQGPRAGQGRSDHRAARFVRLAETGAAERNPSRFRSRSPEKTRP